MAQEAIAADAAASNKKSKKNTVVRTGIPMHGLMGVVLLIVCVSIGYCAFLVLTGTTGWINRIMVAPALFFVVGFLAAKAVR